MRCKTNIFKLSLLCAVIIFVASCGGGDEQSNSDANTWVAGSYLASSEFADRCQTPRSGTDVYTGQAYPDKQGTQMDEKMYLRSFSHETYLWYDELPDPNPANFSSVLRYFDELKTSEKTDSGRDKDEFHFDESYDDYMAESQSGVQLGFGLHWSFQQVMAPRVIIVAFTDDNSPAAIAGVTRGDTLKKINDVDVVNSNNQAELDIINGALFSPKLDTDYQFTFETVTGSEKTVTLKAKEVLVSYVKNNKIIEANGKKVGYIQYNGFMSMAQDDLISAFTAFSEDGVDDLVLDMRYNGGGLLYQSAQVGYMIAGEGSQNRTFSQQVYNDKIEPDDPIPFFPFAIDWDALKVGDELPSVNMEKVYILSSSNTASASEALINGLRGIDIEVILIGGTTRGKPYGFIPQPNCGWVYYTVQFKGENEKGFADFADGFVPTNKNDIDLEMGLDAKVPGCMVEDDFDHTLGDSNEATLAAALNYMETETCPVSGVINVAPTQDMLARPGLAIKPPFHPLRNSMVIRTIKD
ncbi:Peptidase family S41 [Vibrio thalassae]|uniref:Peptidase family S41 n=2 Tax=Vibrio thalassae TaxID=1243014 RepID=A0A240EN48_9VIBR|nr:Peptidase family S41 [Vibrio thalassae]